MRIFSSVLETIGNTPLVELERLAAELPGRVVAKMESRNPGGSIKDRIGLAMIEAAEAEGKLVPGQGVIIEPTSGNTGIGLAVAAAVKGYRLILTMPDSMSVERRKLLSALGAEIVLTPAAEGMQGAVARAVELTQSLAGAFMPNQFANPANPDVHRRTTAEEIWRDTDGQVAAFVAGVGTGGTVTGVGQALKQRKPDVLVVAVEPAASPVLSGGEPGPHGIQGIGANFVPEVLDRSVLDEIIQVADDDAKQTARRLATEEGILAGISAGANTWAALQIAAREDFRDRIIVAVLPDTGERYLSTDLFPEP
ncbi:MAG: cysteine synthase A [Armatimonadetes bacterium]|nr:cysteine synthase A [Armatimonadota bacterium]